MHTRNFFNVDAPKKSVRAILFLCKPRSVSANTPFALFIDDAVVHLGQRKIRARGVNGRLCALYVEFQRCENRNIER